MEPGQILQDRYELGERLAAGGMAEVWLAHDSRLDRKVAVKFPNVHSRKDPDALVRFFSEAQSAARVSHPNVVQVLDFGAEDGTPYLVMEYVAGGTLAARMTGPMRAEEAVELVLQAATGAGALHAAGLVHRDLKPANILIDNKGDVKITDLGIATALVMEHLTQTGAAIGSPHYMSPEQASAGEATPASDVYSLGIVLYEALTGVKPFEGEIPTSIAIAHVEQEPVPPSTHEPSIPAAVESVVLQCLMKNPGERPPDGAALAVMLGAEVEPAPLTSATAVVGAVAPATPPPPGAGHHEPVPSRPRRRVPVGAALIAAALLVAVATAATRIGGSDDGAEASTDAAPTERAVGSPSPSPSPSLETVSADRQAPSPSPSGDDDRSKKDKKDEEEAAEKEPTPTPEPEPSDEPSPEPSGEPSPEPSPSSSPDKTEPSPDPSSAPSPE